MATSSDASMTRRKSRSSEELTRRHQGNGIEPSPRMEWTKTAQQTNGIDCAYFAARNSIFLFKHGTPHDIQMDTESERGQITQHLLASIDRRDFRFSSTSTSVSGDGELSQKTDSSPEDQQPAYSPYTRRAHTHHTLSEPILICSTTCCGGWRGRNRCICG